MSSNISIYVPNGIIWIISTIPQIPNFELSIEIRDNRGAFYGREGASLPTGPSTKKCLKVNAYDAFCENCASNPVGDLKLELVSDSR